MSASIAWHRRGFRLFWRRKPGRGPIGRPRIPRKHIAFIQRISGDHPEWGEDKIAEELAAKAREIARRLAAGPTVAYRYMKENLNRALAGEVEDCMDLEATHHVHCGQTEDHREASKAFVEKREPVFKGR